ncbi:molybdopterin-binding protein [Ornithinimicrobium sp. INDO-MA30-4]|uniref:TOBE domain-containing protein n=1 Tax=Ornithinimicrobium sp. INDO-MA30-4 TaxID=2908651 RepID=UPI001F3BFE0F|nr:TOBE domain-containing protein [Ornithinimicrobium sp. INDO-MA30-4]UJH69571.1 TOBE domain-containing protein [Ornithinimicrobium sp. INDO-MA30-4]
MTHLRVSEISQLVGVSSDTVRRAIDHGTLPASQDAQGRTVVPGADVARYAQDLANLPRGGDSPLNSARNQLHGIVTNITMNTVMAQVDTQCGPFRVVSLLSAESVREMGLEVGSVVVAGVKATHVTIGLPQ